MSKSDRCAGGIEASTPVLTLNGWVPAADLRQGDVLATANGTACSVVDDTVHTFACAYRIGFNDGSDAVAGGGQPLGLLHRYGRDRSWTPLETTVGALAGEDLRRGPENRYRIPLAHPLVTPPRDLPIGPYVLGAHIANGYANTSVVISTPDPEVTERLEEAGGRVLANNTGACGRVLMSKLIGPVRALGLDVPSAQKFIPPAYLAAGLQQRVDLLHGLMDGDGTSSSRGRSNVRYSTTSHRLAEDVVILVNTLGGTGKVQVSDRTSEGKATEYTVTIMLPAEIDPFFTTRKRRGETRNRTGPGRAVQVVEAVGACTLVAVLGTEANGTLVAGHRCVVMPTEPITGRRAAMLPAAA